MGTEISFKRPDGDDAKGYLSNAALGNAPGVVVVQEWWGLQDQIRGMCDRFALAGFDALAPDLYRGVVVPYHDTAAANKEMSSLNFMDATEQVVRGAVQLSQTERRKGRPYGFLHGGRDSDHRRCKGPRTNGGCRLLRHPARAGRKTGRCEHSASRSFR
jgi:carboxymethylenebutenolidase